METSQSMAHLTSRERVSTERFPSRPRAASDVRDGANPRTIDTSRAGNIPKGFEGMLRNTTETGDIGMFSIKPSRFPQSFNTPRRSTGTYSDSGLQKPKQPFQPYGVPSVDDRRRLPSYARDTASEPMMYDSASQRSSSRTFDEPDYRSYSMTQTSNSSYTLSNHKSYASLRSQQDYSSGGFMGPTGNLQRPRSPFAYPTRLRRPGFRPSSPALTDGGIVDYSRRAEIDRLTYNSGHNTSSPSSLYALKRKPHITLRPEANRSTPSLLSQSSPQRRSSSPQTLLNSGSDWPRSGQASLNTSPARSTFSFASTVNPRASATATSVTTTPGKIPLLSPLYYDYTEDFEVDERRPAETLPPPLFTIHKTIPEDRPMSSHGPITGTNHKTELRMSLPLPGPLSKPSTEHCNPQSQITTDEVILKRSETVQIISDHQGEPESVSFDHGYERQSSKPYKVSSLSHRARELSSHVEEVFGLEASTSFNDVRPQSDDTVGLGSRNNCTKATIEPDKQDEQQNKLQTTPDATQRSLLEPTRQASLAQPFPPWGQQKNSVSLRLEQPRDSSRYSSHTRQTSEELKASSSLLVTASVDEKSTNCKSHGPLHHVALPDASESTIIENVKRTTLLGQKDGILMYEGVRAANLNVTSPEKGKSEQIAAPLTSAFHGQEPTDSCIVSSGTNRAENVYCHKSPSMLPEYRSIHVLNFSHQGRTSIPKQEPPMLAPKPISPARQLKLKNSIPQLMKALPPLPLDLESQRLLHVTQQKSIQCELPRRLSPVLSAKMSEAVLEQREMPVSAFQKSVSTLSAKALAQHDCVTPNPFPPKSVWPYASSTLRAEAPLSPPKLKLKLKVANTLPPEPSHSTKEMPYQPVQERYSLVNQDQKTMLLQTQQENGHRQPRFKLKVTKAYFREQGTVRINRSSGEASDLNLGKPKDLFSPTSGIENVFRQVSRHIHSRRTSTTSSLQPDIDIAAVPITMPLQSHTNGAQALHSKNNQLELPSNLLSSGEVRSCFSDDSSQEEGQGSLRRRLTNLKSKIPVPYVSKVGAQSYDDITWKDRNGGENPIPVAAKSTTNLVDSEVKTNYKPARKFTERLNRQRLKMKMQGWLKDARAAFTGRAKLWRTASA